MKELLFQWVAEHAPGLLGVFGWFSDNVGNLIYLVPLLYRRLQVTVDSGYGGVLFRFGRVREVVEPGFHWMIPFVDACRVVPTRQRTLDLEDQVVTTREGVVLVAHLNVVYQVVDPHKAITEVVDLDKALRDSLCLSVQRVLGGLDGWARPEGDALDQAVQAHAAELVRPWGIHIEAARFVTMAPSRRSLRFTQLAPRVEAQRAAMRAFGGEVQATLGLALASASPRYQTRSQRLRQLERLHRERRR